MTSLDMAIACSDRIGDIDRPDAQTIIQVGILHALIAIAERLPDKLDKGEFDDSLINFWNPEGVWIK